MVNPVVDLSPEKFAELGEEGRNSELQEVISKIQRAVTAGSTYNLFASNEEALVAVSALRKAGWFVKKRKLVLPSFLITTMIAVEWSREPFTLSLLQMLLGAKVYMPNDYVCVPELWA